jgi:signal transduction histidine kinase
LRKQQVTLCQEMQLKASCIFADRQKLRQVFLNLLTNAADAMPRGGKLTIRTASTLLYGSIPGVTIEVVDTGIGIPQEHLAKIMEPFFTTKAEGKGTGLGLAICRRVIEEHDGLLEIFSQVGLGTTVRLSLPLKSDANVHSLRAQSL